MRVCEIVRLSCWTLLFSLLPIRVLAFDYFEHRYLGNHAYLESTKNRANWSQTIQDDLRQVEDTLGFMGIEQDICKALPKPTNAVNAPILPRFCLSIENAHQSDSEKQFFMLDTIPVRFGDLSALAGDHVEDPDALEKMVQAFANPAQEYEEHQRILVTRRHWINACLWYKQSIGTASTGSQPLNACFDNPLGTEMTRSSNLPGATTGYAPSRLELAEFEQLPDYASLAGSNKNHFPMHSWKAYIRHHLAALDKAEHYRKGIFMIGETAVQSLKEALIHEGIAQHFLQDSFAAGHIASQYGSCWFKFCFPSKTVLQHTHDYLNGLGISVTNLQGGANEGEQPSDKTFQTPDFSTAPDSRQTGKNWIAFGDRHLFIAEGVKHRSMIEQRTTQSLKSVIEAAMSSRLSTPKEVCEEWLAAFPIPTKIRTGKIWSTKDCEEGGKTEDLSLWQTGRSPDPRVPDLSTEGWKFLVTWGTLYGKFTHLNEDGSSRSPRASVTAGTFELGYVRATDPYLPNYLGAGVTIAPGNRMSVYPASVGYWRSNQCDWAKTPCFLGIRANGGVRITEPFSAENPSTHRDDILELNMPLDFGIEVYPPIALYVRADLFTVGFPVISDPHSWEVDSIFAGRGALTFGIRYDLAGIFP